MNCYVYIVQCADGSYYTGITSDIYRRLYQHNNRIKSCLQKSKIPVKLAYIEKFYTRIEAARKEKEIKGWSRLKKFKLIEKSTLVSTKLTSSDSEKRV